MILVAFLSLPFVLHLLVLCISYHIAAVMSICQRRWNNCLIISAQRVILTHQRGEQFRRLMFGYVMSAALPETLTFIWRLSVFNLAESQQRSQQAGNRETSQICRFCAIWRTLESPRTLFKSRLPHKWKARKHGVCEFFFCSKIGFAAYFDAYWRLRLRKAYPCAVCGVHNYPACRLVVF